MTMTAAAVAIVVLGGCGSSDEVDVVSEPPPSESDPPSSQIVLTVEISQGKGTDATTWELRCEPAGGDHPQVDPACDTLQRLGAEEAFAPVPADTQCTMIYGGPQVASVTGHWGERHIDARFERTNGCEISRWDALVPVLPKV